MPDISEHTAEIDAPLGTRDRGFGAEGGLPVFWRSAPSSGATAPALYLHGVPTNSDDWLPFLERSGGLAP
ncbi:MAG TPA: hypothetical protein VFV03_02845, partial [Solirubrobacteraceae bacterium]|nr:hypothetical protein [Solirubrobacteraceae bacterium]